MIDARTAKQFYHRSNVVGKTLSFECNGAKKDLEIVGIVEAGGTGLQTLVGEFVPSFLYTPSSVLQQMTGQEGYSQISLMLDTSENQHDIISNLIESVERQSGISGVFSAQNLQVGQTLKIVTE